MKKGFYVFAGLVAMAMSATAAIDWNAVENIIPVGAEVVVSSNDGSKGRLIDGNEGSNWQARPSHEHGWFYVDLGETKEFTDIEIFWEAACPSSYSVYVTDAAPAYSVVTIGEDANAFEAKNLDDLNALASSKVGTYSVDGATLRQTVSGNYTGRFILVYTEENSGLANAYGICCHEVRAGNITGDLNVPTSIRPDKTSVTITAGETVEIVAKGYNILGSAIEGVEYTVSCADERVVVDGHRVSCNEIGVYTLNVVSGELSATVTLYVNYNWAAANNVAINGTAYASHQTEKAALAIDGIFGTAGWEVGAEILNGTWFYVDLKDEYIVKAIGADWENAYATDYTLFYATEQAAGAEEPAWIEIGTYTQAAGLGNHQHTDVLETPVNARYIKLLCNTSQVWGMHLFEFMIDGEYAAQEIPTSLEIESSSTGLFTGETATVVATVKNQYGVAMDAEATLTVEGDCGTWADGTFTATKAGVAVLKAVYGDFSDEISIVVADANTLLSPVSASTNAKNDAGADRADKAIDGTQSAWFAGRDGYNVPEGENPVLIIDLGKKYDISAVTLDWEGANSKKYTVSVSEDGETYTPAYTYENLNVAQAGRLDRFFGLNEGVRYVKFESEVYFNQGWGLNLYEIRIYGESSEKAELQSLAIASTGGNALLVGEETVIEVSGIDQWGMSMVVPEYELKCNDVVAASNTFSFDTAGERTFTVTAGDKTTTLTVKVFDLPTEETTLALSDATVRLNGEPVADHGLGNPGVASLIFPKQAENIVVIDMGDNVKAEYLEIKWEAACASDYTVRVASTEAALDGAEVIFSVSGRQFKGGINPVDRVLIPAAFADGFQFIRIHATGNASDYESKIMGVTAYGKDVKAGLPSAIEGIAVDADAPVRVYNLQGIVVRANVPASEATVSLPAGVYIVNGKKVYVR